MIGTMGIVRAVTPNKPIGPLIMKLLEDSMPRKQSIERSSYSTLEPLDNFPRWIAFFLAGGRQAWTAAEIVFQEQCRPARTT
ncbi:hypothetical protein CWO91_32305 [Bradyrhizobium genosp. SA-3]|nr:hypothetical protein CWO91_32305 [Bradyrhizobium genosp. SA-3]